MARSPDDVCKLDQTLTSAVDELEAEVDAALTDWLPGTASMDFSAGGTSELVVRLAATRFSKAGWGVQIERGADNRMVLVLTDPQAEDRVAALVAEEAAK